jgi:hypothetical protein
MCRIEAGSGSTEEQIDLIWGSSSRIASSGVTGWKFGDLGRRLINGTKKYFPGKK